MVKYRNVQHGRIVKRARPDEWLEASAGWVRVEEVPAPREPSNEEQDEGSKD